MESPSISLMEDLNPAISYALNGDVSLNQLKKAAEEIEDDLKAMDGVSKIRISGYPVEEMEISVRENDLKKYDLSFQDINRAISSENIDITGGTVKSSDENFMIRSNNKKYNANEISEIVVKKINNRIIKIKDIASC
jgi:multidrug efflux pump subunit AcrB